MLTNYIKIAFRNLWRNKLISGINILGLSVGIACCILIALYVFNETSYDRFHKNSDRIVRATMELSYNSNPIKIAVTGTKALPEFKRVFPEVENGVRFFPTSRTVKYEDKIFRENEFVYADSTLFDVFSFQLIKGDPKTALAAPNQLVITVSTARKYFGDQEPVGKTLLINNQQEYIITGVVNDCPANSQIKFDVLGSWRSLTDPVYTTESWFDASHYTYLLLKQPGMHNALNEKIAAYFDKIARENGAEKSNLVVLVQPLTEVHLQAIVEGGFEPGGDVRYVYLFSIVAIFILVIACANYVNLTTARASERAKEVGLRKVTGATRRKLIVQFMGESLVTVFISLLISLLLVEVFLPVFNLIASKQITLDLVFEPLALLTLTGVALIVGFFGGLYPSLVLSGFKPVKVLKGNFSTGSSGTSLRKGLIILQFIISASLIASTLTIKNQLAFIQNKKLGYDKDRVMVVQSDASLRDKMETIKARFKNNPEVLSISTCNQTPVFIPGKYNLNYNNEEMLVTAVRVDKDFVSTMQLSLSSGADFIESEQQAAFTGADSVLRPVMLNETLARNLGWTPDEAVGKTLKFQGRNSIVKAVVNDFHFSSMHQPIGPIVIFLSNNANKMLVRISGSDLPKTIQYMKAEWAQLAPQLTFEYEFLEDQFNKLYSAETKTGKLFNIFALLGILLASLGLFGLVTFTAKQKTKEIGIRKVLGASVSSVILLLSKGLLRLVVIATLIALPVTWRLMDQWLQNFAYHADINWGIFLIAGGAPVAISFIILSVYAMKAAANDPINSLRNE
jgi:putative ABC transport system permease protein